MKINLGNFFIKKPLRWAFSQAFGSKAKTWFDDNVALAIDVALSTGFFNYDTAILKFLNDDFINKIMNQIIPSIEIPKKFEGVAKDFIKSEIDKILKEKLNT